MKPDSNYCTNKVGTKMKYICTVMYIKIEFIKPFCKDFSEWTKEVKNRRLFAKERQ